MAILDRLEPPTSFRCRNANDLLALTVATRLSDLDHLLEYSAALNRVSTGHFLAIVRRHQAAFSTPETLRQELLTA